MTTIAIRHREPNGRPQRKVLKAEHLATMSVAMNQPHRKGATFPDHEWRGELFGRLILDNGWGFDANGRMIGDGPKALYEAGRRFKQEYRAWQNAVASKAPLEGPPPPVPVFSRRQRTEGEIARDSDRAREQFHRTMQVFRTIPDRCHSAAVECILHHQPEDYAPSFGAVESTYDALVALAEWYGR